jgi:hypothetical protein
MTDEAVQPPAPVKPNRRGLKLALVGAGIVAGAIGATAFGASAATDGSGSTASPAAYGRSAPANAPSSAPNGAPSGARKADHGSAPVRSDEKAVTGTQAATLKAAALKAVPGGTVYRVETDAGDGTYEVHMTKADGTEVTVKFDKNLAVTTVEAGMGTGDPAPAGK